MKWIKASERLPEPNKMLHLKHTGSLALGYWNPMQNGFSVGTETYNIKGCEWLDESICPELAEEIERLKAVDPIKFLHWVRENDFVYSDGNGWFKDEFDIVIVNALTYISDEQLLNLYIEQLKSK